MSTILDSRLVAKVFDSLAFSRNGLAFSGASGDSRNIQSILAYALARQFLGSFSAVSTIIEAFLSYERNPWIKSLIPEVVSWFVDVISFFRQSVLVMGQL
jgi:hypothetical protein